MNLLVIGIGIGHEKDLIIGYRYRFKFFISCIPNNFAHYGISYAAVPKFTAFCFPNCCEPGKPDNRTT